MQNQELRNSIKKLISKKLSSSNITHKDIHIEKIIAITNYFKSVGRNVSYGMITDFICSKQNRMIVLQNGLDKVLDSLPKMKMLPIINKNKQGRNCLCNCGSGLKYKKCCYGKK